jgi:hypothetical protein
MQRRLPVRSSLMILSSLLAAGGFQAGFAQKYGPADLVITPYGIDVHGRQDGLSAFCNHSAEAGGRAPTVQQAVESSVCTGAKLLESQSGELVLTLIDGLIVEMGIGRPFDKVADARMEGYIDQSALVYPLRGSFTLYRCVSVRKHPTSAGKNCNSVEQPDSTGTCYKAASGSWECDMTLKVEQMNLQGENLRKERENQWTRRGVPPPVLFQKPPAK